jgi:hypothetical protein
MDQILIKLSHISLNMVPRRNQIVYLILTIIGLALGLIFAWINEYIKSISG